MLEITANDIALLNDEHLRSVVARLCEAELRQRGYSAVHVTWGGNQNAADGGIDVRVALPPESAIDGYVPRPPTGFQVKAQDMPASAIAEEMLPNGAIRPSIQALADQAGAYIIVSSQGSVADTALTSRREAMTEATKNIPNVSRLHIDFYDRTRVASWVRSHAGLIPWVRKLVGRAADGWQSYGAWAFDPDGAAAEYLLDEKLRVHWAGHGTDQGLSATQGLKQMRSALEQPRQVLRLVGLSGMGKTRLIQALFDDRVGEASLDPALALYTDVADGPNPQPTTLASNLAATGSRAILVIDNCPPDLHRRLSEVCRQADSKLSIITVEYDIRDDQPEGTDILTLKSCSPDLIEKLVRRRYPRLSPVDAHTIAESSDGNARIALVLADTVKPGETIAGLKDEQLFHRLFRQRHEHDESLYRIAQACALVYSFQGDDLSDSATAELIRLGRLIGITPQEVFHGVAELQRRDLVQRRSVWRSVLPHAIANRLAATALQNLPYATLESEFVVGSTERLMRSFSRRLGYLGTSQEAIAIVHQWLSADGLLGKVAELDDLGRAMFQNVAPAAPEHALAALERAIHGEDAAKRGKEYVNLLRSLAYDAPLFDRAAKLLVTILTTADVTRQGGATRIFVSLFHLFGSGTHATIEQRISIIKFLLDSADEKRRSLGVLALKAVLEGLHFSPVSTFDFGARSRDFGYRPNSPDEVQHWFNTALRLVETVACSGGPAASHARAALAVQFRGLWLRAVSDDEIARVCTLIHVHHSWPDGWLAVRQSLDLDGKGCKPERLAKLVAIERALRPADLAQKVRAVVFPLRSQYIDFDEFESHGTEDSPKRRARTEALAQELGKAVAMDDAVFVELLHELVSSNGLRRWSFGRGLVDGASDRAGMWQRLVAALGATEEAAWRLEVMSGFLHELRTIDPVLTTALLDDAVEHDVLAPHYPYLQVAAALEASDVARLKRSVTVGRVPAIAYRCLAMGCTADTIPPPELRELLLGIAGLASGNNIAIEVLDMRLRSDKERKLDIAQELIDTGRKLIEQIVFTENDDPDDHARGEIAIICLTGEEGAAVVTEICARLKRAVENRETSADSHSHLLVGLFTAQPAAALDGLLGGDEKALEWGIRVFQEAGSSRSHPLAAVSEEDLLRWCEVEPKTRYPAMANLITFSQPGSENTHPCWTSIALRLLEKSPDPGAILRVFKSHFVPEEGWVGSLSSMLESKAVLLDQLNTFPELQDLIAAFKIDVQRWIDQERRRESSLYRGADESFE